MKLLKKISLVAALLLATTLYGYAQGLVPKDFHREHVQVIQHTGYTTAYNSVTRTPDWVAWTITAEKLAADVESRKGYDFQPDPQAKEFCPDTRAYSRSGYDRGHMCPAADCKWSADAMRESFYLSNVCPQINELNSGFWLALEKYTRRTAKQFGSVDVICGPIRYGDTVNTIGDCKVVVPDAFFRIMRYTDKSGKIRIKSWIVPNIAISEDTILHRYEVDIQDIEQQTGLKFL